MSRFTEIETAAVGDVPRLFTVSSVANVNGYHNVPVNWFVNRLDDAEFFWSSQRWPALIAYDPRLGYGFTQAAIAELRSAMSAHKTRPPEGAPFKPPADKRIGVLDE